MSQTDFGYQKVSYQEKQQKVDAIFDKVSPYYDLMNDLMSLGCHRLWKEWFVSFVDPSAGQRLCDLACGSGDITLALLSRQPKLEVVCVDPSRAMLTQARTKLAGKRALGSQALSTIEFIQNWAENLCSLDDESFDAVVCSFGFRNMTEKDKALREIYRILKPGGTFHLLEFSQVQGLFKYPYQFFRDSLLPQIGRLVGDRDSYQYLAQSIDVFWSPEKVILQLSEAGLKFDKTHQLTGGICQYYCSSKVS